MGALREVNLELGMPYTADAVRRLTFEVHHSKELGCAVLKIIHGYGSTGKGGKIRVAARERLDFLLKKREIRSYIPGERFTIFNDETRCALQACPELRKDRDLERSNNGVTFILL
ncbi:MAG: hypothetical protein HFF17_02855 [Oscillospiraceae bacterium]|nr:hypothetical protein [Oscillospiraceae bacterium]